MKKLLLTLMLILSVYNISSADQRSFVWTYEYMIMPRGSAEIEQYTTLTSPDAGNMEGNTSTELNFEAEIGMSENYDFAIYQNFKQGPDGDLKYSGFKLRTRYKIGEKGDFFVDPLIYLEYKGKPDFHEHEIEAKLILERDFGDLRVALNPYFEYEFDDDGSEFVPKYAVGLRYAFSELFTLGFEGKGDKNGNYIGPTISHGSKSFWSALGVLYGVGDITEGKPEIQVRMILGLHL